MPEVRTQRAGAPSRRTQELAWRIAELASTPAEIDSDVAEAVVDRVIDIAGVAAAGFARSPVAAARHQALAHRREGGATLFGVPQNQTVHCEWAAWANCAAVRELDFHDNFFAVEACHPGDAIPAMLAVAQQCGRSGADFVRGIATAYEVQIALAKGIPLGQFGIDHVAHLGPAIAAGLGALLGLPTKTIYYAVGGTAHLSASTRQTRRGRISSWKAQAPGHVAHVAITALDRAMRGETTPTPIWEGGFGLIATMLGGPDSVYQVPLPSPEGPRRAILETYTKEHSAAYHGQAAIDLAFRMRKRIRDIHGIRRITLHTHRVAHVGMGSGAGDPEKWDPRASRETLDHSLMYIFCVALQDGTWDHEASYARDRARRLDTVRLWRKIETVEDPQRSIRYYSPNSLDKDHGMKAVIEIEDGNVVEDEIAVAHAHPRGEHPFGRTQFVEKFIKLAQSVIEPTDIERFLKIAEQLPALQPADISQVNFAVRPDVNESQPHGRPAIFDAPFSRRNHNGVR